MRRAFLVGGLVTLVATACTPHHTPATGPQTTDELRAEWDTILRCDSVEACLTAIERPRYVLDADAARMAARLTTFGEQGVPALAAATHQKDAPRRREIAAAALLAMKGPTLAYALRHDDAQSFDLLVQVATETTLLPRAYPALVERLPAHRDWLHGHLRAAPTSDAENPGLAVLRLLGSAAVSEVEPLCKLLDGQGRAEWELAENTARALGFVGAQEATPCLVRALDVPSFRVTSAALEALARIGRDASSAQRAVLHVATSHWSQRVRWRAVTTLRFLREPNAHDELEAVMRAIEGGRSYAEYLTSADALADPVSRSFAAVAPDPAHEDPPVCAWNRREGQAVRVEWEQATHTLPPLATREARARVAALGDRVPQVTLEGLGLGFDVPLTEALRDIRPMGDGHLVAACAGEFGGGLLYVGPERKPRVLVRGCFQALREVGGELVMFEGAQHLGDGRGRLWKAAVAPSGVEAAPLVALPGSPLAARVHGSKLLVATTLGDVVVTPAGEVAVLGCEPP